MASKAEGWTVEGNVATFNGGTFGHIYQYGKKTDKTYWSYTVTVTLTSEGLNVDARNDDDMSGQAHGGSYTDLTIPLEVLTHLQANVKALAWRARRRQERSST